MADIVAGGTRIMFSRVKTIVFSVAAMMLAPGIASADTFNTTGNTPDNGNYGNVLPTFTSSSGALTLQVTGWQINQGTGAISTAYVGAYSPGIGVTGVGDYSGNFNYHQIDNAGGYTDFVLLQFNQAVTLQSLYLNSFALGGSTSKDNDLSIAAINIPNFSINSTLPTTWTNISGTGANGTVPTGITLASKQWLVAAGINSTKDGYDAFKIASITVSPVPEPAAWTMMIVGFGAVGFAMRVRRADRRAKTSPLPDAEAA